MNIGQHFALDGTEYEIKEKVGEGGYSEVYKAVAISGLKRPLAVKVLLPQYAADDEWKRRFDREAKILANIDHAHVVRIRATWDLPNNSLAIIQDFVEDADDMRKFFRSTTNAQRHLSIALQVLYGLREAHTCAGGGAIHRDLSPSNVLIDKQGHARIIDFGLARAVQRNSPLLSTGPAYGTPGIAAPEQYTDFAKADHRVDLFGLGRSIAASHQDREPSHAECGLLPEPWRTVCLKLTNHDITGRHQSCEEAIEDLFSRFLGYSTPIVATDMLIHCAEMQRWAIEPRSWPAVARRYVHEFSFDFGPEELHEVLMKLSIPTVIDQRFGLNALIRWFDEQVWEPLFGGSFGASFSSTDGLGSLLRNWMFYLEPDPKLIVFRRLVRTAVNYNRFYVMGCVRSVYSSEPDQDLRQQFIVILEQEDPGRVIHGISGHSLV